MARLKGSQCGLWVEIEALIIWDHSAGLDHTPPSLAFAHPTARLVILHQQQISRWIGAWPRPRVSARVLFWGVWEQSREHDLSILQPLNMGIGTWEGEKRLNKQEHGYHLPRETTKRDVFMQENLRQASSRGVRTHSTVAYIYIYIPDGHGDWRSYLSSHPDGIRHPRARSCCKSVWMQVCWVWSHE